MSKQHRPNILIFNPDQWRSDVIGHLGNPAAQTPHLDRLVQEEAISFRNAFCQNPVCVPSRCSFMTGHYPHVRGHRTMGHMLHTERGEKNLLQLLKENGYYVWWGGKNHLLAGQDDIALACDEKFTPTENDFLRWGHIPRPGLHVEEQWRGTPDSDTYYSFYAGRLETGEDDRYFDEDWANIFGALEFIREYDGEQPFCIFLPLFFPHPPYGVEEPWFSAINRQKIPPRTPAPQSWVGKPSILQGIWENQHLMNWSEARWTELRAAYYGMCSRVDHQFGLILEALRENELYHDTAIFFFSDHGDFTGDYGLVEKTQNTFEDCLTNVPFIFKPPREINVSPRVCDALIELLDFPATVLDLTGIAPGYTHFGRSLLPLLEGSRTGHREAVFCEGGRLFGEEQATERNSLRRWHNDPQENQYWPRLSLQTSDEKPWNTKAAMCRTGRYKYVRRLYEQDEFYDLEKDPQELSNLIEKPHYRPVVLGMKERLLTWYMETCDVVPFDLDER